MSKIAFIWCILILTALPALTFFVNDPNKIELSANVEFYSPVPINTTITQKTSMPPFWMAKGAELFYTNMTVKEVHRGTNAYELLQKTDAQAYPAPDGYDYLLVKVHVDFIPVLSTTSLITWSLNPGDFQCYFSDHEAYPTTYVNAPSPNLYNGIDVQSGESADFWLVFLANQADSKPRMYYFADEAINYWFALYKT